MMCRIRVNSKVTQKAPNDVHMPFPCHAPGQPEAQLPLQGPGRGRSEVFQLLQVARQWDLGRAKPAPALALGGQLANRLKSRETLAFLAFCFG